MGLLGEDYLETERPNEDILLMIPGSVRITLGWFFPENNGDENAIYWDYYFTKNGNITLVLDVDCENGKLAIPIGKIINLGA